LSELYLVEGDSAGGSAKQGRDRKYQAILPLKGKILNVEKARFEKLIASQEIATLITVLGTGIGNDEYNANKLRYHRIIIMTDADVDGSHIRTLLLTFFYRQMPELIERGHIYIAQPPLYKIKQGKDERYLKDDLEMKQFLFKSAINNATLFTSSICPGIQSESLEKIAEVYFVAESVIERLSRYIPQEASHALMILPHLLLDNEENSIISANLIQETCGGMIKVSVETSDNNEFRLKLTKLSFGNYSISYIDKNFLNGNDYVQIRKASEILDGLIQPGAYIKRGENKKFISSFKQALEWILEEAKRGLSIQRYKGLGEMNPSQLWETTMDYENRILLKVKIEDAISADEIFTTLMGDIVEPRRNFIEKNALGAKNLDV
jgi:DNA gyrase subunit B